MTCRRCRPNQLCKTCALNAQAAEEHKRREALQAVQPTPPVVVPKPEPEPVGPGVDAYDYRTHTYRPGHEPKVAWQEAR